MLALARLADRGPFASAVVAAMLIVCALWVPALMLRSALAASFILFISLASMACLIASAAVVAFVALRHGERAALQVVGSCLLLLVVLSVILYGSVLHIPLIAVVFWLPAIIAAIVLARTVNLNYSLMVIILCGLIAVALLFLVMGDSTAFWESRLGDIGAASVAGGSLDTDPATATEGAVALTEEQREGFLKVMAQVTTGALGVSMMSVALGALCLARSWQAGLGNPGAFQKEFHALTLGRGVTVLFVAIIALTMLLGGQFSLSVAIVLIFGFSIQGLAVVHSLVKQRGMHRFWLHGIYVLLMLPHTLLLLAALGVADNVFSLRRAGHS